MSGMGTSTQSQTQTNEAPSWAAPALKQIAGEAGSLYNSGKGFDYFPGSTVTPFSTQTQQGLQGMENYANTAGGGLQGANNFVSGILNGQGSAGMGGGLSQLQQYANGDFVNGGSQAFRDTLDYGAGKIGNAINQQASANGRYGSSAHSAGTVNAMGNYYNTGFNNELNREQGLQMQGINGLLGANFQAAGMAPGAYQNGLMPYQTMGQVGSAYEGKSNQYLQDEMARFQNDQQKPWNLLGAYQGAISGLNPQAYKTTSTTGSSTMSPMQQFLMASMGFKNMLPGGGGIPPAAAAGG